MTAWKHADGSLEHTDLSRRLRLHPNRITIGPMKNAQPRVVVVGSLNTDLVFRVPRLLASGETLTGTGFDEFAGGKGLNQAVAAARLGAQVAMVGRVGADGYGDRLMSTLAEAGIASERVLRDAAGTGLAFIMVSESTGENIIGILPRGNGQLSQADVAAASALIASADVLLLQLEVPLATSQCAAEIARASGTRVVLNPAPAQALSRELLSLCDFVTPNEGEATRLTGVDVVDDAGIRAAAEALRGQGASAVVMTLGARGVYALGPDGELRVPAFSVSVVDTTAAGDAFSGGLAYGLASDLSLEKSLRWGCAAGALACTRLGAVPSLPTHAEAAALVEGRAA